MSRRRIEHGPQHDAIVLLVAVTAIAALWLLAEATDYDEPEDPTPPPSGVVINRDKAAQAPSRSTVRTAPPQPSGGGRGANPQPSGAGGRSGEAMTPGAVGTTWHKLAMCESTNNPQAVSPDGTYRGLFQFDAATWQSVGGTGDPAQASRAEQLARAIKLHARRGWQPWPQCATQLGLHP